MRHTYYWIRFLSRAVEGYRPYETAATDYRLNECFTCREWCQRLLGFVPRAMMVGLMSYNRSLCNVFLFNLCLSRGGFFVYGFQ